MPSAKKLHRCAILDDYQNVALGLADWASLAGEVEFTVFNAPLGGPEEIARALQGFDMVVLMRERTAFPRRLIEALPDLKLLISTGKRNWMLDVDAARERGIVACSTETTGNPTTAVAIALMLELTRRIGYESERLKHGAAWQSTLGVDIEGKTLGLIGLGRLGQKVAKIARALGHEGDRLEPEPRRRALRRRRGGARALQGGAAAGSRHRQPACGAVASARAA